MDKITHNNFNKKSYLLNPSEQRFERKFTSENLSYSDLENILDIHPALFIKSHPDRWVNNIYYDTFNLDCYKDHVSGCASRSKYRVRWYGDHFNNNSLKTFEIKRKNGLVGSKIKFQLFENDIKFFFYCEGLNSLIRKPPIDMKIISHVENLNANVGNRYYRSYYETSDGLFRITIDKNLEFFAIPEKKDHKIYSIADPTVILELKYNNKYENNVSLITNELPLRLSRMSKYILGIDSLKLNGFI
jgi:SPX domain protein involved in polyphosphate accumulation